MKKEQGQEALFDPAAPRARPGRVRLGLDADVKAARAAGGQLPHASVALLRSLADQLDQLERGLRPTSSKPWDRMPLSQLGRTFHDVYSQTFTATMGADPLDVALANFLAGEAADADHTADSDTPDQPPH